jgi:DNA-directed RNA polymerase III subunit RPC6
MGFMCCAGIWTKDLRMRTNLAQPQVTKMLRTLEARALVKSVKSVSNPNRKVYMLAELEPSRDITGGAWCVCVWGGGRLEIS